MITISLSLCQQNIYFRKSVNNDLDGRAENYAVNSINFFNFQINKTNIQRIKSQHKIMITKPRHDSSNGNCHGDHITNSRPPPINTPFGHNKNQNIKHSAHDRRVSKIPIIR